MIKTANPALNRNTFQGLAGYAASEDAMTINGVVNKSALLLILVLLPATYVWNIFFRSGAPQAIMPYMLGGMIGGLVFALITIFSKTAAPYTAPVYALLEGLVLGGLSAIFEAKYPGIVVQAVLLTFGTLFALLIAYRSGIIMATENFKLGVFAATGGIMMVYLVSFLMNMFGKSVPYIHGNGTVGIVFSLFVVVVAALNLVLDFDFIESGVDAGAPKYMEWYAAFGLMVTLIWLYIEILRLLVKIQSRRR